MNIYFACTGKKEPIYLIEAGFENILCSFHYYKNDTDTLNGYSIDSDTRQHIIDTILPLIKEGTYGRKSEEEEILQSINS